MGGCLRVTPTPLYFGDNVIVNRFSITELPIGWERAILLCLFSGFQRSRRKVFGLFIKSKGVVSRVLHVTDDARDFVAFVSDREG